MVAIKLPVFAGMVPAIDDHLLGETNASYARDTWLYSGALDGFPVDTELFTLKSVSAGVAYRIPNDLNDPVYMPSSTWIEFEDPSTDLIAAPVAADNFKRFYWASSTDVPKYNTVDRIRNGSHAWRLGLDQPDKVTVAAAISGGSSGGPPPVTRAYTTTYVTEYGEEGPASFATLATGQQGGKFTITVPRVPDENRGQMRSVKFVNIYRTIVGASGASDFYFVAQIPALGVSYTYEDTKPDSEVTSNARLRSAAWTGPPSDLEGMVVMPNGIIAGWRSNELWFSEPYRPHAWPAAYALTLEHEIVGLGVTKQTLVVCTNGKPYTASGVNPASITTSALSAFEPCISRGSILSTEEGVYYASPNGLILVNPGTAENVTRKVMTRDKWIELTARYPIRAGRFGTGYAAFGAGVPPVFQAGIVQENAFQIESNLGARDGFMIDPFNENAGVVYLSSGSVVANVKNDRWTGEMLVIKGGKITWMDQAPIYPLKPYVWRSKIFQSPEEKNFTAMKCWFYIPPPVQGVVQGKRNNKLDQVFDPKTQIGIVRVFADDRLVATRELRESGELLRLPSGFKADFWQVEIEAVTRIQSLQMATSVKELSNV